MRKVVSMHKMRFGRKKYSLKKGKPILESTSVTVRTLPREDEETFTKRLIKMYGHLEGTVEMVFKAGRPDYAVITFSENVETDTLSREDTDAGF